jgi:hypothetical protein
VSTLKSIEDQEPSYAARIGLDWADQKHFWTLLTATGKRTRGELKHTPEAIEIWAVELARSFGGRPIALALEQKRGALVAILSKYAHLHLFPLHPTKLGHYRASVCASGAKSDPSDADLILDYLVKHPEWLPCLAPDTVETRSLQFLVEERRKLVNQHTSQLQILLYWLKQIFRRCWCGLTICPHPWSGICSSAGPNCQRYRRHRRRRCASSLFSTTAGVKSASNNGWMRSAKPWWRRPMPLC